MSYCRLRKEYEYLKKRPWKKVESSVFQYGYYYSLMITIVNAATIFSVYVPFLCFGCCYFVTLRFLSDSSEFIFLKGSEIAGDGSMFHWSLLFI